MKERLKKVGVGLAVGAVIVLGGGFASADYTDGNLAAEADATVTYTIASFRAIELEENVCSTPPEGEETCAPGVEFGTVRQGEAVPLTGPTIYYGTTWMGDDISAYLDSAMLNGVKLYVAAGVPSAPVDESVACDDPGEAVAGVQDLGVDVSTATSSGSSADLITGIDNCGAPSPIDGDEGYPDRTSLTWATATTLFTLDSSGATDLNAGTDDELAAPQSKTLSFIIE